MIPLLIVLFTFALGRQGLLPPLPAAGRRGRVPRHRQAVDVEDPASDRSARDQRAARAGRPADPADDDLRGRHPQLLRARPSASRPTSLPGRYTSIWFTPTKPGRYHLFCAEYCGTEHSRMIGWVIVHDAGGVPGLARRRCRRRRRRPRRASSSSPSYACTTCHRRTGADAGPALARPLRHRRSRLADGGDARRRRRLPARVDPDPARQGGRRATSRSCRPSRARSARRRLQQLISYIKSLPAADAATAGTTPARQRSTAMNATATARRTTAERPTSSPPSTA